MINFPIIIAVSLFAIPKPANFNNFCLADCSFNYLLIDLDGLSKSILSEKIVGEFRRRLTRLFDVLFGWDNLFQILWRVFSNCLVLNLSNLGIQMFSLNRLGLDIFLMFSLNRLCLNILLMFSLNRLSLRLLHYHYIPSLIRLGDILNACITTHKFLLIFKYYKSFSVSKIYSWYIKISDKNVMAFVLNSSSNPKL